MKEALNTVHKDALKQFDIARNNETENRRIAEEDYLFLSGDEQWPLDVRKERESAGQPCLTINRLPQFVRQVMGDARQNKPAIKVRPVEDSDEEVAEIYEGLIRSIEQRSNAGQAYMTALEHALSGGFGHWRVNTEYCDNETFNQDIKIERIANPFSVFWDGSAKRYDRSDAEHCFVTEWISKDEYKNRYKNASENSWESDLEVSEYSGWTDNNDRVRIAEYWVKNKVEKTLYQYPDGSTSYDKIDGLTPIKTRRVYDTKIEQYILSGTEVLEGPNVWPGEYIPIVSCWGIEEFVGGRYRYVSLIRHSKDSQRMYNYWQSTLTEKIALAPKAPWLVTAEQIKGLERFWDNANTDSLAYLPYNNDSNAAPPQRNQPALMNVAEIQQAAQSIDDMKATTGIYDASLGNRSNEQSGVAIRQREMQGDTATFAWIDNLSRSIEYTGRILVDLVPKIYDTTRVVEILYEDDSTKDVELNKPELHDVMTGLVRYRNDLSVGKYDVAVRVGPSYATKRQEAAESMVAFMQAVPNSAAVISDLIAKNMDWPGADDIAERLKKTLPPDMVDEELTPEEQAQREQAMAQQQQEAEMQKTMVVEKHQMEMQQSMADVRAKMAKAAKDISEAEAQEIENAAVESEIAEMLQEG